MALGGGVAPTLGDLAGGVCLGGCGLAHDPLWGVVGLGTAVLGMLAMLAYGLVLVGRPPSLVRTVVKTAAVGALAATCAILGAPWALIAALVACAIGDAFLAGDPKRWLAPGLLAFLVGHGLYISLFAAWRDPLLEPGIARLAALAVIAAAAVALLAWLWRHIAALRPAVVLYVIVISAMAGFAMMLDAGFWPAMAGSVAFMASDAVLAISLFRGEVLFGSTRATNWTVWFLYCAAQVLIAGAFIGLA